jgi:hypothetical protein
MRNLVAIRCADGKTIYMKSENSPSVVSCKNIIAGTMLGVSTMISVMIAFTYM